MSVNDNINKTLQDGNGTQTAFAFNFKIFKDSDIKVYKVIKETEEIGNQLILNTDYTVSINRVGEGGVVTFTVAPTTEEQAYIYRDVPITQPAKIPVDTEYVEKTLENALDRACMISQQLKEEIDRSIKIQSNLEGIDVQLPTPDAGKTLKWNENEDGLENSTIDIDELESIANRLHESIDNIDTVADNILDVNDVADNMDDINIVASHIDTVDSAESFRNQTQQLYNQTVEIAGADYQKVYNTLVNIDAKESSAVNSASQAASSASQSSSSATVSAQQAVNAANSAVTAQNQANLLSQIYQQVIQQGQITVPAIDSTLAVSGAAADAKVTGDLVNDIKYTQLNKNAIGSLFCYEGRVHYGLNLFINFDKYTPQVTNYKITFKLYVEKYEGNTFANMIVDLVRGFNPTTGAYYWKGSIGATNIKPVNHSDKFHFVTLEGTFENSEALGIHGLAFHWNDSDSSDTPKYCKYYIKDLYIEFNNTIVTNIRYDCTYEGHCGTDLSEPLSPLATKNYADSEDINTLNKAKDYANTVSHNLTLRNFDKSILGTLFKYQGQRAYNTSVIRFPVFTPRVTSYRVEFDLYLEEHNDSGYPNAGLIVRVARGEPSYYYYDLHITSTKKNANDFKNGYVHVICEATGLTNTELYNLRTIYVLWDSINANASAKYYIKNLSVKYNDTYVTGFYVDDTNMTDLSEDLTELVTRKYVDDTFVNVDYVQQQLQAYDSMTKSSLKKIVCYGDSITEGGSPGRSWATVLQELLGNTVTVTNCGISGQCSGAIAFRQGGVKIFVNESFTIPATADEVSFTTTSTSKWVNLWANISTLKVYINGIYGSLSKVSNDNEIMTVKFVRSEVGETVEVEEGTEIISEQAVHEDETMILWAGRNDMAFSWPYQITGVIENYRQMVEHLSPKIKRYLIVSTTTTTGERDDATGSALQSYGWVLSLNSQLAELYPNNFVDIRNYLKTQCIYDAGIVPTAEDLDAMEHDTIPQSLMYDFVHPNAKAKECMGQYFYRELEKRGWV